MKRTKPRVNLYKPRKGHPHPQIVISYPSAGKRRTKSLTVRSGMEAAQSIAANMQRDIDLGQFELSKYFPDTTRSSITLQRFTDQYIAYRNRLAETGQISASTVDLDRDAVRALFSVFDPTNRMDGVNREVRHIFCDTLITRGDHSNTTINKFMRHLAKMFNWGLDNGFCELNPFHRFERLREPDPKEGINDIALDDLSVIIAHINNKPLPHRCLVVFALCTGCRAGGALRARHQDISEVQGIPCIELREKRNKTRIVPLIPPAVEAIEQMRVLAASESACEHVATNNLDFCRRRAEEGYIFYPFSRVDSISKFWRRTMIELKLSYKFHDLRKTTATWMLNAGVPVEIVSAIVGHSSTAITLRHYARVKVPIMRDALEKMDGIKALGGEKRKGQ